MNATRSPLGDFSKLPAEIRNEIWMLAITTQAPIKIEREYHYATACFPSSRCPIHKFDKYHESKGKNTIEIWAGKKKRALPPSQVLGIGLLRASKAIHQETTPMFYGLNHFDFGTPEAVERMVPGLHRKAALLANVSFPVTGHKKVDKGLRLLNRMARPRNVIARKVDCPETQYASRSAEEVWDGIKQIVGTQTLFDPPDVPNWNFIWVDLPMEVQLERFSAFSFDVKAELKFDLAIGNNEDDEDVDDDGPAIGTEEGAILDVEERGEKYKSLVNEVILGEAAEAAELKQAQKKALRELMRARRAEGRI